jgi:KDO2-lipid IV(A) lauroyltransferase
LTSTAGTNGLRLPFFGHDCSTNPSPADFCAALQLRALHRRSVSHRPGEMAASKPGEKIPTHDENGQPRTIEDIMRDVLRTHLKAAVRRDPANWFWVHRRWKASRQKPKSEART